MSDTNSMMKPERWFASDNNASVRPEMLAALEAANAGHAVGYGDDPLTARAEALLRDTFGAAEARLVWNGTGANVFVLAALAGPGSSVICAESAHIAVDETGAPEAVAGVHLELVHTRDGRISPAGFEEAVERLGSEHQGAPAVLSLSQPTEQGVTYSLDEIRALAKLAHHHRILVHIDGARLSNAAASLGVTLKAATFDLDVDAVCFGGTKNGLMYGEAVLLSPEASVRADWKRMRKTCLQLPSKMRFIAAQFMPYLEKELWKDGATRSNGKARLLARALAERGIHAAFRVDTNAVFVRLPEGAAEEIRTRYFFYDWEGGLARFMTSWDTEERDIADFLSAIDAAIPGARTGSDVSIRPAIREDAAEIAAMAGKDLGYPCTEDSVASSLEGEARGPFDFTLVAVAGGKAVGFLQSETYSPLWTGPVANVVGLAVRGDARRSGVGSALMRELERTAKERGAPEIRLASRVAREEAHAFYESLGYANEKTQYRFRKPLA